MSMSGSPYASRTFKDTSGVEGRVESHLRMIRGRINTTTPTILEGSGFTVVRNGAGDVTLTFSPAFAAVPTVTATAEADTTNQTSVGKVRSVTASTVRLQFNVGGVADVDGIMHFVAIGPT